MLWSLMIIVVSFIIIWLTSDVIVKSISGFSKRINLSPFSASFIVLGILTSVPEFSIGINSIIDGIPQVLVGNLIGGIMVLFCFVCPWLAIAGNGIKVNHSITPKALLIVLVITAAPAIIALRGYIDYIGAILMMGLYLGLVYFMREKKSVMDRIRDVFNPELNPANLYDILRILAGMIVIFFCGKLLVDNLEVVSVYFNVHPYLIGLIGLSIGTNLPELFIGTISVINKQRDIAFGHYLGSAASNGFFLGFLTLINGPITIFDPFFFIVPMYILIGLSLFYYFVRKNNDISRSEGFVLLTLYVSFVIVKIFIH